jgi:hypothetical protein
LPNLAKYTYGLLPLAQRHKIEKKKKKDCTQASQSKPKHEEIA